ncbi:RNA polymerase I-specific transcription initiation factor RRN3 [Aspergillus cavernicola]|uniref:RNA polymerase I-specific transcription initiation factor RRN3 n=1 Tax=Aspergillus cavernicola TaxID=176166 RepID=A0ABR4I1X1_9EURO
MVSLASASRPATGPHTPSKMLAASSPVPILKTSKTPGSVAGVKHRMEEMDLSLSPSSSIASDAEGQPSPRKKTRVQFDEEVKMREIPYSDKRQTGDNGTTDKSAAVVREEVRRAIQRHVSGGDSEAYDRVKEIFAINPRRRDANGMAPLNVPTHNTLKHHLMGLLSNVAALDRSCNGLVQAVLDSEWLGRDASYIKLYIRFLGNLSAAQGSYLGSALKMLTNYLRELPRGTGKLPGYPLVHPSEIYTRVHMALRHVMQLIPSGSGSLSPILSTHFPFENDSAKANIAYTQNLVRVISYAPELQADILALITEKLVKIDVQIQVDMEDLEDDEGEDVLHDISPETVMFAEEVEDDDDDNASVMSDESIEPESRRLKTIKENILKLDGMIDTLFEYYAPPFRSGTIDDKENALDLLLNHFQTIILPTYRSRHSQFLLFHFSQASPVLVDRFAATCVQIIFNKAQPAILRQSAAAYLASFVSRGAHISGEVVRDVFDLLSTHLNNLRLIYEPSCRGPDLRRFGPFYSTAQALLYIFCFRWRDLTTAAFDGDTPDQIDDLEPEDIAFPPNVRDTLHKAILSKLNPLKVCSPAIVAQFARMSQHLNFIYVFTILETNKRLRISAYRNIAALADPRFSQVERETRAGDDLGYQLDAYFPFDPYQLPRSRRWLEGDYVHWRGIPGLDDRDDDDNDSDADEEAASDEDLSDGTETDHECI